MNIFRIEYIVVLHDDQNEMPFCNWTICNRYWYLDTIDMQGVLRLQNTWELIEQYCNVDRDPSRARLSRKIKKSVSFVYRKSLLMRKLEPRYDNPPLASSSLSILSKRFVLSIVNIVIYALSDFYSRSCTTVLYPTSSLSSYCLRDRRKDL